MLLSHKTTVKLNNDESNIVGHMCYAAYKLWNVCNFERVNYKTLDLPKICAYMLKERFSTMINKIEEVLEKITKKNPLNYDLSCGHPFYEYKFKKLLAESTLGMLPSRVWDGTADATGGYIIVKENGEVLCYHLFNRNEFETYLIKNTRFETASTSRHEFGTIFKENEKYYIKLNLQVRFIK